MDVETILNGLVRIGTVTDIDNAKRRARVLYQDDNYTSGWLYVLDNHPHIPDYDPAPQKTAESAGGSAAAAYTSHSHDLIIKGWMPRVNDTVLVLYLPVFNADGFVLGGIG